MLDGYLIIALIFYAINAYGYHEVLKDNMDDVPFGTTLIVSLVYL